MFSWTEMEPLLLNPAYHISVFRIPDSRALLCAYVVARLQQPHYFSIPSNINYV